MTGHPYRAARSVAPPRERRSIDTTPASALPLAVIAITFFLPVMKDCDDRVVSPLDEASKSLGSFFWIAPLFLASAVLGATIVHTYVKRRGATWAALLFVGLHVASAAVVALVALGRDGDKDALWALPCVPATILYAVAPFRRGRRRLSLLVDAHLFAGLALAALVVSVSAYWGGYTFSVAFLFFVVLRAAQLTFAIFEALRGALRGRFGERHPAR